MMRSYKFSRFAIMLGAITLPLSLIPITSYAQEEARAIEEIVVTARKRDELLQDIPMSVSVVTGRQIEEYGIQNVEQIYGDVPNLYFAQNNTLSPQSDSREIMIRGVGSIPLLEPSTGLFIDGIYQTGLGFDIAFLDLERVEVLRGPQGTLFGRNTQAGAVNLVTRKPDEEFRARAEIRIDNLPSYIFNTALSGPVVEDKLFIGIAAQFRTSDGYLYNEVLDDEQDDHETGAARLSVRYLVNEDWEVNLTGDFNKFRGGVQGPGVVQSRGESHVVRDDIVSEAEMESSGGSLRIDGQIGNLAFTSLTGYRENKSDQLYDQDGLAPPIGNFQSMDLEQSYFQQEFRLSSTGEGPFSWLVGLYYFEETHDMNFRLGLPAVSGILAGTTADNFVSHDRKGGAVFGQASYTFSEQWELTAGIRVSEEDIDATRFNQLAIPALGALFTNLSDKSDKYSDVSPMGSLAYKPTDEFMIYATVAQGYKAGGFEKVPTTFVEFSSVESETSLNKEIGIKGNALDGRFQYGLTAFHIDIDDMQLMAGVEVMGIPQIVIDNAGKSTSQGIEVEFSARFNDNLKVSGNLGYTDTEFDEYIDADGIDRRGQPFPGVPQITAGLTAEFRTPLQWAGTDFFSLLRWRYVDDVFRPIGDQEFPGDPNTTIPSYNLLGLQVGIETEHFTAALYATNLLDEFVVLNRHRASFIPESDGSNPAFNLNYVGAPQIFGVRIEYRY